MGQSRLDPKMQTAMDLPRLSNSSLLTYNVSAMIKRASHGL